MIYINTTSFVLIIELTKGHILIEITLIKNVVTFFQTVLSFALPSKIIKIYSDIARKHGNVIVQDFWKYKKLKCKRNKLKLDIDFLNP